MASGQKFTLDENVSGPLTVIADYIEVRGRNTSLRPASDSDPVLFYKTLPAGKTVDHMTLNADSYDWEGYVISRFRGITLRANRATSPQEGMLEAEWVSVSGENFRMFGTGPDTTNLLLEELRLTNRAWSPESGVRGQEEQHG
jgi:hypothetical protein